jgi:heme-degrading monooxygenase HmoA
MQKVLARLNVEDFDNWKLAYESHESVREQYGCKGTDIFRKDQDSKEVVLIQVWDSLDSYSSFTKESNLKEIQKNSGVSPKEILVLNSL